MVDIVGLWFVGDVCSYSMGDWKLCGLRVRVYGCDG